MPWYPKNIRLLLLLNEEESEKFKEYLSSTYFNKNKKLLPLYEHIVIDFKEQEKTYCEDDFILKSYGSLKTAQYKSHLLEFGKHFKRFIAVQQLEQRALLCNQLVLEDYLHRSNGDLFMKQYAETKKESNRLPLDINQFQNEYQIEELYDEYLKKYSDDLVGDTNLQVLSDAIDRNFILKKLCCNVLKLNRSNIATAEYSFDMCN